MSDVDDFFNIEPDETTWMTGRMTDRTYLSKTFPLPRPGSADNGQPARFVYKVFDDDGAYPATVETAGTAWTLSASPAGRTQVKLLLAREGDHIKDLWIQRLQETKDGPKAGSVLHLSGVDAEALLELFRNLHYVPIQGAEYTTRIDDALIRRVFADPNALATYDLDPEVLRALIEQDANARDVVATAGRRTTVQRFRQMLEDEDFFNDEKTRLGVRGDEAVWQHFFEDNPWILGVSLTGQLLTSWDHSKLEQVVAGYSIIGAGKRADALLRTAGVIRSMVFAEFKTASAPLLESHEYRSGCWVPSHELVGAVVERTGVERRVDQRASGRGPWRQRGQGHDQHDRRQGPRGDERLADPPAGQRAVSWGHCESWVMFGAIVVKLRDGQVTNKPFYVVIGVTTQGERDILGIWAGGGGEGAKFWLNVLSEIKNRGASEVCIAVCDGLKGLPEAITTVWELTQVQTCVVHLIRNTFRHAGRQDRDAMAKDPRPIYTAVNAEAAADRLEDFASKWQAKYPAAVKLRHSACNEFIPFLDYDGQIRKIIRATNAIESLNAFAITFQGRINPPTN